MPIDESTKNLVTSQVRQTLSEMEPSLMAAATKAGRDAAALHCSEAHRGLFDASSRIEAGNLFQIDQNKAILSKMDRFEQIMLDAVHDRGVRDGEQSSKDKRNNALKVILGASGLSGLVRWVWLHWFSK